MRIGAAVHSVRAVAPAEMADVGAWASERRSPLHAHVSEQPAENEDCLAAYGAHARSGCSRDAGLLDDRFTAVHATHLTDGDIRGLGPAQRVLLPDDRAGPGRRHRPRRRAGRRRAPRLCLGSDSHAVIDLFEEARAVELDERLATGERGHHSAGELLARGATTGGADSLGWPETGRVAQGALADLIVARHGFDPAGRRRARTTSSRRRSSPPAAADVRDVMVAGRWIVRDHRHLQVAVREELAASIAEVWGGGVNALVIDRIGLLVTNDPSLGEGPLGLRARCGRRDRGRSSGCGHRRRRAGADERLDAAGRCVIPGFVDSHTHLVFAGDRAEEFTARMAGRPYAAGGIAVTTDATRRATDDELRRLVADRLDGARRGGTTHVEVKSGYALDVDGEARLCRLAAEVTDDVTFLGAHLVPAEYAGRADDYVALVAGPMLDACAPWCRWVDVFCETGAFDADQSRAVLEAGRGAGPGPAGARQPARYRARRPAGRRARRGVGRPLHAPHRRRRGRAGRRHDGGHAAARQPTSRPASPTRTPAACSTPARPWRWPATATRGRATRRRCPFCMALAVREMRMTAEEALWAATAGGAAALRRPDLGRLSPGSAAHAVVLDAPTYHHLAYRPGMPLIAEVVTPDRAERDLG